MPQSQVSSSAGWDATPGRLDEQGLSEGQLLSVRRYRYLHLIFGVGLPVVAIAAEWFTRWSAAAYVNPLPNRWLAVLALSAPAANLAVWIRLCLAAGRPADAGAPNGPALIAANRLALAVSFGYCLLFLPIVPAAVILSVFAVGLLPLAPFFTFYTAWRLDGPLTLARQPGRRC